MFVGVNMSGKLRGKKKNSFFALRDARFRRYWFKKSPYVENCGKDDR